MARDVDVKLKIMEPRWPNFVYLDFGDGMKDDGRKVDVGNITDDAIERLCESFRDHCLRRREREAEEK